MVIWHVVPNAARKRSVGMMERIRSQNGSCEMMYEAPAFGRKNEPTSEPNAELRSRRAPS
jgi:hypothetical protein